MIRLMMPRGEKEDVFCVDCGAKRSKERIINCYNIKTGEPFFDVIAKCPNRKWWSSRHETVVYEIMDNIPVPPLPLAPHSESGESKC